MTLRKLPEARFERPKAYQADPRDDAMEKWHPKAAKATDDTISIYDVIGQDWWTGEGMTAKRVAGALRSIGQKPVTVSINSPGGDVFEGLAIYNLLREHPAEVTVRVMGMAASAASVIAMAGDRIEMGLGSFMMIHNSWGAVVGNQNDMREAAETFAEFDAAMADIYAARSGMDAKDVAALMDAETLMRAEKALDLGFADGSFEAPEENDDPSQKARAKVDAAFRKAGLSRAEGRRLWRDAGGTPGAAVTATPSAGFEEAAVRQLIATIKA